MIVDSAGSREIATIDRRPIGEFDQTPEFWRCNTCEHVNPFDGEEAFNGFLAPKVSDYMDDMACRKCGQAFTEESWVISPFWVYLGTWNGRVVAEGGPWHWNMEWHRDCAGEDHTKDDCYATRRNGRRRRENPCINKTFALEPAAKGPPVPPILVVDTDRAHSSRPPSAGLTPFPEDHGYDSERGTAPEFQEEPSLHPDNQTVGTNRFTIADYGDNDEGEAEDWQEGRGLEVPYDDHTPDLGSYYDAPADDEEQQSQQDPGDVQDDQSHLGDYYGDDEPREGEDLAVEAEPPPGEGERNANNLVLLCQDTC
jgi:collagen type V/XI/XXIV/XXVII alpha